MVSAVLQSVQVAQQGCWSVRRNLLAAFSTICISLLPVVVTFVINYAVCSVLMLCHQWHSEYAL